MACFSSTNYIQVRINFEFLFRKPLNLNIFELKFSNLFLKSIEFLNKVCNYSKFCFVWNQHIFDSVLLWIKIDERSLDTTKHGLKVGSWHCNSVIFFNTFRPNNKFFGGFKLYGPMSSIQNEHNIDLKM